MKATGDFREELFSTYQESITRQDFIYLAVRIYEQLSGEEILIDPLITFTDTEDVYALKGASVGITTGIGNEQFGPSILLTREQLATLMIKTLDSVDLNLSQETGYQFNDETEFSEWSKSYIYRAKANGIIDGVGNDKFDAKGSATREQALLITNKMLEQFKVDSVSGATPSSSEELYD